MMRRFISNKTTMIWKAVFLTLALVGTTTAQEVTPPTAKPEKQSFEFKDGDRLVLIGNTVIEREQRYGTLEPRLALALGDTKVSVRNLAWSGDTVFGHARSYFGPPEEGIQRLTTHLDLLKPTVVMLCYGSEMAFEGLSGLPNFLTGYRNLLDLMRKQAPGVRLIIVSPPPVESLAAPLPLVLEYFDSSLLGQGLLALCRLCNLAHVFGV
jgi:hypothetical protein